MLYALRKKNVTGKSYVLIFALMLVVFAGRLTTEIQQKGTAVFSTLGSSWVADAVRERYVAHNQPLPTLTLSVEEIVRIPQSFDYTYTQYNALQQSQGYDLKDFRGKLVTRYVFLLPVVEKSPIQQLTVLVYNNRIIGGDLTELTLNGAVNPLPAKI